MITNQRIEGIEMREMYEKKTFKQELHRQKLDKIGRELVSNRQWIDLREEKIQRNIRQYLGVDIPNYSTFRDVICKNRDNYILYP